MITIRPSRTDEGERVVEIWRGAVDATHGFLTPADRLALDERAALERQRKRQEEADRLACSLENKEACLMCSG